MKLASLKSGRDGRLVVVSTDQTRIADASSIAPSLQAALDEWEMLSPHLKALSAKLDAGGAPAKDLDPIELAAPFPRVYQFIDCSAYVNHEAIVRRARGGVVPRRLLDEPLMQQTGSDALLGPTDAIETPQVDGRGVDFEAEIAVVLDDTPMGVPADEAAAFVRLFMLVNDVTLRSLVPDELSMGWGLYQSKPTKSFAPFAVTPDELGLAWDGAKAHLPVICRVNGLPIGKPSAGVGMTFDFPTLIAHAARTRNLCAGTVLAGGVISNAYQGEMGRPVAEGGDGYACLLEQRMVETIEHGNPRTPFLSVGDRVEIEVLGPDRRTLFGKIDQTVVKADDF